MTIDENEPTVVYYQKRTPRPGDIAMRHELWSDGSFFPLCNRQARTLVESGSTLVWTVDAPDWVTAMTAYHQYKGWEPYRPMDDDPGTYTTEQEADARK